MDKYINADQFERDCMFDRECEDMQDVIYKLRDYPPADVVEAKHGEWVSCDERLPEEKGEYLVTYHPCYWDSVSKEIMVGIDTFRGKTKWAKSKYQRVIAWMPKPKPYVERKETDE